MSRRLVILLGAIALFIGVAPATALATSGVSGTSPDARGPAFDRRFSDPADIPAPNVDDLVQVFIQLDLPSVAEYVATQSVAGSRVTDARQRIQRNAVLAQQARTRSVLAPHIVEERSALQIGANGFRAMVRVGDVPAIQSTPGVKSVARVTIQTPSNATSVPWIGADDAWVYAGETGYGVSIAVIDTGIDYYHANFGGSGDPDDFAADDPTIIEGGTFPTAKVVGGWDFAGEDYDASGDVGSTTPTPDPDPVDCYGHGSHVAGTAAGYGVLDNGSTFGGPYNGSTYLNDFRIGPGVAPGADLYAFKVFGCDGSTDLTSDAIERALDPNDDGSISDAVDVINMSLGSPFGSPDDPSSIASDNAVMNGVVVVASAGNEGPAAYVTGSPGVAEKAISVAASIDGGVAVGATQINSPAGIAGMIESLEADFSAPLADVGPVTGDLAMAEPLEACTAITNPGDIAGNIALVQRGSCDFVVKYQSAQDAGATGLVVFDHSPGPPITMAGSTSPANIPAVFITLDGGATIRETIVGGDTVNVTLDATVVIPKPDLADSLADFTASGPAHFDSGFKPDLAAPGFSIESTGVGTGDGPSISSGTSMAAPHVAGMAAILRDEYPDLDPTIVRSLLQNSASPAYVAPTDVGTPDETRITLQGAGIAHLDRAVELNAYTMPAGVSFGHMNPLAASANDETVWVHSMGGPAVTYDIDLAEITSIPGVTVSAPATVTVPGGGGSASFDVTMALDPTAMPPDDGWFSQTEADGRITLVNQTDSGDTLNLAYFGVVDPASDLTGTPTVGGVDLDNGGPADGWAEGFSFIAGGDDIGGVVEAFGVRKYDTSNVVEFGLANEQPWNSLSAFETDIYLDTDQNGTFDYELVAADLGFLTGSDPTGQVVTGLFDLNTSAFPLEYYAIADNNDRVQILPVDMHGDTYGFLANGDTDFDYTVVVWDLQTELQIGQQSGSIDLDDVVDADLVGLSDSAAAGDTGSISGLDLPDTTGMGTHPMVWMYSSNVAPSQFEVLDVRTTTAPYWAADAMLEPSDVTRHSVTLAWPEAMDSDGVVVSYDVWKGADKVITLGADSTTYTVSGLSTGILYDFAVTATDDDGFDSVPLGALVTTKAEDVESTVGAFDPSDAAWTLRNSVGGETTFVFGEPGDQPIMGDWNCNGVDTPGVFRDGLLALRNTNSTGIADHTLTIGDAGDVAFAGDFDGDGCDTIGLHRPSTGQVFVWNSPPAWSTTEGGVAPAPDLTYYFGNPGDKVFAGDFDGDGIDTVGLHRESTGFVYFRNSHTQGIADNEFYFGDPGDRLIAGDWGIVNGVDTPAVFRPSDTTWYFRHTNTQGIADSQFMWGDADWLPVAGSFGFG